MSVFLISPYSSSVPSGNNPKNYPYWQTVVDKLYQKGHKVLQIGVVPEKPFEHADVLLNYPLEFIERLVPLVDCWLSVDNFFVHLASRIKPGIVLYGPSDPRLFGYDTNDNLFVLQEYFRAAQYDIWTNDAYDPKNFVPPEAVLAEIHKRRLL